MALNTSAFPTPTECSPGSKTPTTPVEVEEKRACPCNICMLPVCTCPRDVCEFDVKGIGKSVIPGNQVMVDLSLIYEMLIDSISCGDEELREILQENVEDAYLLSAVCGQHLQFLNAQLHLIDIAMIYSRNRVDIFKARAQSEGTDKFDSISKSRSEAQRTSQGTSCSFSDQSSFQQFQRDSVDRFRSRSDTSAMSYGESLTTRTDRSKTAASGYSAVSDFAEATTDGSGVGNSISIDLSTSRSYSKTGQLGPNPNDLDTGQPSILPDPLFIVRELNAFLETFVSALAYAVTGGLVGNPDIDYPDISFDEDVFSDNIGDNYNNPGVIPLPNCPALNCFCPDRNDLTQACFYDVTFPHPSYGRGWNVDYSLSINAFGGETKVTWGDGASFRQQDIHTQSCSSSTGSSHTDNVYDQIDLSRSEGATETRDQSTTDRDVVVIGDSFRDARSDTKAGSATTGDAHSESHSGADRGQHSEGQTSNQGTSLAQSHSESQSRTQNESSNEAMGRKYSQIFKALSDLWKVTFDEIKLAQTEQNARIGAMIHQIQGGKCFAIPYDPVLFRSPGRRPLYGFR